MSYLPPSPPPAAPNRPRRSSSAALIGASIFTTLAVVAAAAIVVVGLRSDDSDPPVGRDGISLGAFVSTTAAPTTTTAPTVYSPEELVVAFGDAVWRVESEGCGEIWTGSAFAIDEHHLVTNHHVVANSTRPELQGRDGSSIDGTVIGWSERPDIAVIEVDEPLDVWLDWAPTDELNEGQSILAIGYPVPDTVFTATPGSIMSFQARTGVREALRTNAALDRGNSGGPALDRYGRVVGVVTEMAANAGGLQLVPLVFTHDALSELIEDVLADPEEPTVACSGVDEGPTPGGVDPDAWASDAYTYGDDKSLDVLWDQCEAGDMVACDDLWWTSPPDSEYEAFADTCGGRNEPGDWCSEEQGG